MGIILWKLREEKIFMKGERSGFKNLNFVLPNDVAFTMLELWSNEI